MTFSPFGVPSFNRYSKYSNQMYYYNYYHGHYRVGRTLIESDCDTIYYSCVRLGILAKKLYIFIKRFLCVETDIKIVQ